MTVTESQSHNDIQFIHDRLYEFNLSKTGGERQEITVPATPERTAFVIRDENDQICGGTVFYLKDNGTTLYIDFLWMAEKLRGQNFGTKLIAKVKERAIALQCRKIALQTRTYQAPDFYPKQGFTLAGTEPAGEFTAYHYEMILN